MALLRSSKQNQHRRHQPAAPPVVPGETTNPDARGEETEKIKRHNNQEAKRR